MASRSRPPATAPGPPRSATRAAAHATCSARRFDADGRPVQTSIAAGTNEFAFTTDLDRVHQHARDRRRRARRRCARVGLRRLDGYDHHGVACRSIDAQGMAIPDERDARDRFALRLVASITPLSNGNFAVTWNAFLTTERDPHGDRQARLHGARGSLQTIDVGTTSVHRSAIAAAGTPSTLMYAWIADGSVHGSGSATAINTTVVATTRCCSRSRLGHRGRGVRAARAVRQRLRGRRALGLDDRRRAPAGSSSIGPT